MKNRKNIKTKLMRGILMPMLCIIIMFGLVITTITGSNTLALRDDVIRNASTSAAYQISEFFTEYLTIVDQMSKNEAILDMMREMKQPGDALLAESYDKAEQSLNRICDSSDIISLAWTVDLDSKDSGSGFQGQCTFRWDYQRSYH